jgi:hypothetical protein
MPRRGRRDAEEGERPPFMILGMDVPLLAFVVIGGGVVLFGAFWLFFTQWPLPRYCGGRRSANHCGWIQRAPPIAPANLHEMRLTPPSASV